MKAIFLIGIFCVACAGANPDASSSSPAPSSLSTSDWPAIRADREKSIARYLAAASGGYEWFSQAMHGEPAGTPFLLMRVLPELAPDIWGPPGERLARIGFIDDPKDPTRPLPLGFGWVLDPVQRRSRGARTIIIPRP